MDPSRERRVETVVIKARHGADQIDLPAKKITRVTKWRDGNPQFLAEARAAAADIRKMLGLDAQPTDPPAGQGAADPEAARRALMAAAGEPTPSGDEDEDEAAVDRGLTSTSAANAASNSATTNIRSASNAGPGTTWTRTRTKSRSNTTMATAKANRPVSEATLKKEMKARVMPDVQAVGAGARSAHSCLSSW